MKHPKISIITPSYNQGEFIEETLQSIYFQNYPNIEHIIIDGGSTDNTLSIIKKYEGNYSILISEKDNGQTDALIKGFNLATGDIWCWLNSDDLLSDGALYEIAAFFDKEKDAHVVYGDAIWIDRQSKFLKHKKEHGFNRFIWLYHYNFIPQPSTFWRREAYREVGGLDRHFDLAMDADLWIRFSEKYKIHHIKKTLSSMRYYREQKNLRLRGASDLEDIEIRKRYIKKTLFKKIAAIILRRVFLMVKA